MYISSNYNFLYKNLIILIILAKFVRFNSLVEELPFQNLRVEHKSSVNLDNLSWEGPKIPSFEIPQQYKDVEESNIEEYKLWDDLSKLKTDFY